MKTKPKTSQILLVEDEDDLLYSMQLILERKGYSVTTAQNGREALAKFREALKKKKPFHLVITDIQMPDLTGTELVQKIYELEAETPTLVITGYGSKEVVVDLMRLGCRDYLEKPFLPSTFLKRILNVLERSRARREVVEDKIRQFKKEAGDYETQLAYYRSTLEKFQKQFKSAKGTYENLIHIKKENFTLPLVWRLRQYAELGGDYFDVKHTPWGCDILLADVTGHDMGASYHTILIKAFFEENSRTGNDGVTFFNLLNRQLLEHHGPRRIITAIFIRLHHGNKEGEVLSAGHPTLLRMRKRSSSPFAFKLSGDVLGVHENVRFEKRRFLLKPGDRYFAHTDGILGAAQVDGATGKKYKLGQEGLERLIAETGLQPLETTVDSLWNKIMEFCRYKPGDDMLLLGFEIPQKGE